MSPAGEKLVLEVLQRMEQRQEDFCERIDEVRDGVNSTRAAMVGLDQRMALHEQHDEHRFGETKGRLVALEQTTSAVEKRHVSELETTVKTWKGRIWAILASLITSAIVGLAVYYLKK